MVGSLMTSWSISSLAEANSSPGVESVVAVGSVADACLAAVAAYRVFGIFGAVTEAGSVTDADANTS